ncbi:peptide N-acetyl-beta-D-glucosaminyl asparaginase amidase A-domain-containing protein [Xylariaceae sp. FL1019]|nr:peptide N-acetyl-beta-D-glucosaminyl asparaginase amidase A-domain-containing protein [Xylariaceae sp. FL1019]
MRSFVLYGLLAGIASASAQDQLVQRDTAAIHPLAKAKSRIAVAESSSSYIATNSTPTKPLECFQVAEPILTPSGLTPRDLSNPPPTNQKPIGNADPSESATLPCAVVLMEHMFTNSYGAPFVGNYTPPDCDFDRVVINFTTLVKGRQYDRTGVMYLGDYEVWRTSTAEPTATGIRWEWLKDMTAFTALWKEPQTVIFDLENIVNDIYTGILNTTLTATFFKASDTQDIASMAYSQPADVIIPISQRLGSVGKPSQFVYPDQNATNTVALFPQNANRAVFTVDVKGQASEEFWWSNVPQSAAYTFNDTYGVYPGYSPFREVQVLIDGFLAGVDWPFPVIYTGGVVPQLNRPIVATQAFDILEHEIDISPFLPLLCDGAPHTFTIKIVGLDDDGNSKAWLSNTTTEEWYVTGKVFVWLDDEGSVTTGAIGALDVSDPQILFSQSISQNATGANQTLDLSLSVERHLKITSKVKTQHTEGDVEWEQSLSYDNVGGVYDYGNGEINTFSIVGADTATAEGSSIYGRVYSYPLYANQTLSYSAEGNLSLWAEVNQGYTSHTSGNTVFGLGTEGYVPDAVGSGTTTWRNGTASYGAYADNTVSMGLGETHQIFAFGSYDEGGAFTRLYARDVEARNNSVIADHIQGPW